MNTNNPNVESKLILVDLYNLNAATIVNHFSQCGPKNAISNWQFHVSSIYFYVLEIKLFYLRQLRVIKILWFDL